MPADHPEVPVVDCVGLGDRAALEPAGAPEEVRPREVGAAGRGDAGGAAVLAVGLGVSLRNQGQRMAAGRVSGRVWY